VRLRRNKGFVLSQCGTLQQLQSAINRRNVKKEPKDDFNACQDFFTLVVESHILCHAMNILKMEDLRSTPNNDLLSSGLQKNIAQSIMSGIVDLTVDFEANASAEDHRRDHVFEYASEVVSLGLLFLNYRDAICEGDGERIMLCWKYFLPLFKATNRRNYAIEAFQTLANKKLLPPRLSHQLIWSRCVNTHTDRKPGNNIPCDQYVEHVNRVLKEYIHHLHANKSERVISKASQCMGPVNSVMNNFDDKNQIHRSISHTTTSNKTDRDVIIKETREKGRVLEHIPGRNHQSFPKFIGNPLKTVKYKDFIKWLQDCAANNDCLINVPNTT